MLSSSLEKYLIGIYEMLEEDKELKISDLAKRMNQPLQKVIRMAERGRKTAEYLIARNALIDEFFGILRIEKNADLEKEAMVQYLSRESLEKIERFVLFNRKYPEISERFNLLLQMVPQDRLLPPIPNDEH